MGKKITCFNLYQYEVMVTDTQDVRGLCRVILLAMGQLSNNNLTNHEFSAVLSMAVSKINTF